VSRVRQERDYVSVSVVGPRGGVDEMRSDFAIMALPATTLRDVRFEPGLPERQQTAIERLRYGAATKSLLQFERPYWRTRGRPRAFGTNLQIGAVWDASEDQARPRGPAILTLLAGGSASAATHDLLARSGERGLLRSLRWLGSPLPPLVAMRQVVWEQERWSGGGYAFFGADYDPELRRWLALPFGRILFAGEHTSIKGQGYMEGAALSGLRVAAEIAALAGGVPTSQG
jgi:monoamine oxidase